MCLAQRREDAKHGISAQEQSPCVSASLGVYRNSACKCANGAAHPSLGHRPRYSPMNGQRAESPSHHRCVSRWIGPSALVLFCVQIPRALAQAGMTTGRWPIRRVSTDILCALASLREIRRAASPGDRQRQPPRASCGNRRGRFRACARPLLRAGILPGGRRSEVSRHPHFSSPSPARFMAGTLKPRYVPPLMPSRISVESPNSGMARSFSNFTTKTRPSRTVHPSI